MIKDVPAQHRLGSSNPTFRANLFVPEGARSGSAVINLTEGAVVQELPFDIELKKFIVEYYDTGMPKLFASEVLVHDRDGKSTAATIKVNEPFIHNGIAIYQSSFDDGGSRLTLTAHPFGREGRPFEVQGEVGSSTTLTQAADAVAAGAARQSLQLLEDHIGRSLAASEASGELRTARNWGQPLDLGDGYEQTPVELRMGYKILKDAGVVPPEVELMREIEALGLRLQTLAEGEEATALRQHIADKRLQLSMRLERLRATGAH